MDVAIFFGSKSDTEIMKKAAGVLKEFGIDYKAFVISAHRAPEALKETVKKTESQGVKVFIAGAGLAAHLPGVIASMTSLPVIGVPILSGGLGGLDALLAIVQMPKPVPVATVGINNAANAAFLALEILATGDETLKNRLSEYKKKTAEEFSADAEIEI